mgnify:CR=1 FL=1
MNFLSAAYKSQIDKGSDFLDWLGGYANGYSMVARALIDKLSQVKSHLTDKDKNTAYLTFRPTKRGQIEVEIEVPDTFIG